MATPAQRREALKAVWHEAKDCTRCPLAATRTTVVFGNGHADAYTKAYSYSQASADACAAPDTAASAQGIKSWRSVIW